MPEEPLTSPTVSNVEGAWFRRRIRALLLDTEGNRFSVQADRRTEAPGSEERAMHEGFEPCRAALFLVRRVVRPSDSP